MATVLYPPIINTYMPAFVISNNTGICKVYFSISQFNALKDANNNGIHDENEIYSVWVSLVDQQTNQSLVNIETYKSGLLSFNATQIKQDIDRTGDNYYIEIDETMLANKKWEPRKIYKIQLRFCSKTVSTKTESDTEMLNNMSSVNNNLNYFSEWSTVCLLQPIIKPTIKINGLSTDEETILNTIDTQITGRVVFNTRENDYIDYYTLQLYDKATNNLVYDSGKIYTSIEAKNEINTNLKYGFEDGTRYILKVSYMTAKMYSDFQVFSFLILDPTSNTLNAKIEITPNEELGCMDIQITSNDNQKYFSELILKRTSDDSNFTLWEDVQIFSLNGSELNFTWTDCTIESGVWYKYCIQKRDARGFRSVVVVTPQPKMCVFHDAFLIGENGQQLKIKFNPQISSFSRVVSESSTQTIGSKYPFIKRNSAVDYYQFTIAGLISHFMDEEQKFISVNDLLNNNIELYENYNEQHNITKYNDIVLEKKFRSAVEDFLYDGKPKLFKSNTEGIMLVRLMNISLTPDQVLSRRLFTFNATAIENDDCTIENIDKYKIQSLNTVLTGSNDTFIKHIEFSTPGHSFLKDIVSSKSYFSIKDLITAKENAAATSNLKSKVGKLSNIHLHFQGDPYLILVKEEPDANGWTLQRLTKPISETTNAEYDKLDTVVTGYMIQIDKKQFLVPPHGRLSITSAEVSDIQFNNVNDNVFVSCDYQVTYTENLLNKFQKITYKMLPGNEANVYYNTDNIIQDFIVKKYNAQKSQGYWKMYSLNDLIIEAAPNTVLYLQTSFHNDYYRVVMNNTGQLHLLDNDYMFTGAYVAGVNLIEQADAIDGEIIPLANNEFKRDYTTYASVQAIENPENNTVYKVSDLTGVNLFNTNTIVSNNYLTDFAAWHKPVNKKYSVIYYNNAWYIFNQHNDVIIPSYVNMYYNIEMEKGGEL